ncbi:ABC transporter substrate-binding protein [Flaviflexus equikiangi]|uniref:ABC transporter substrate-binding protein n=1 Tax=Flaviflexus equikiangi TaxID=2758573 RepID=A0ABS2TDV5_9ACTO|nr:ABC transporter substrate-binding protein [Flaviflexus equikiangi]MBM9432844.1 ABC transporter substrate-binding protein [Flaviflexus equikiangi]
MFNAKRAVSLMTVAAFALGGLAACGSDGGDDEGSVYFLNWKPESEETYKEIAKVYEEETGVPVKVVTAASGTYEQTLKSEVTKSDAPTLFQINGPMGLKSWQSYALELDDTDFAKDLNDPGLALKGEDGKVYGVPLAVEGYGLIYNQAIFDDYFALDGAKASSVDEIDGFDKLKEVTDDMQARKDELGIDGVFAVTSLASGEDWRWQTHLANIPVFYEYRDEGVTDMQEIGFTYSDNYKNIFDLYLTNSTVEPALTPSKTVTDSMQEFATGKAAIVQNGNWAWSQIKDIEGNVVAEEDIKFMPIYTGVEGEESMGINVGTEAFMAVNAKASEADQQATIDFVNWLFSSETGKTYVTEDLGFIAPFKAFGDSTPNDPLAIQISTYLTNPDLEAIPWVFTTFPSQQFKEEFGQSLAQYASGNIEWDEVTDTFITSWAREKANLG